MDIPPQNQDWAAQCLKMSAPHLFENLLDTAYDQKIQKLPPPDDPMPPSIPHKLNLEDKPGPPMPVFLNDVTQPSEDDLSDRRRKPGGITVVNTGIIRDPQMIRLTTPESRSRERAPAYEVGIAFPPTRTMRVRGRSRPLPPHRGRINGVAVGDD